MNNPDFDVENQINRRCRYRVGLTKTTKKKKNNANKLT